MDMIDAGDIIGNNIVLEIGPGKGVLTEKLLIFAAKVVAIEKDRDLIPFLKEKFESEIKKGKLEIMEKDVRDFNPEIMSFYDLPYKVIANIPYYITGEILRNFLESTCQPERMVLMLQKEVAERIVARDKKESILSLSVKVYGKPKIIKKVSAGSFFPKPKVDSAILLIDNISKENFSEGRINEERFFEIIKKGFKSPRKQLNSNLKIDGELWKKVCKNLKISEKVRAEDLDLENWKNLISLVS
jgi:16S rRNA (adenine1518-N6/adenine1519-N6)-dimethyltransferase